MKHFFKFLLVFFITITAKAQVTLSSNFAVDASRGGIMADHLNTFNRINPVNGFKSPIFSNAAISVVRPLGGLAANGSADLSRDTYRWNPQTGRYETDFTPLIQQLEQIENKGFKIHQIVLDNPSWDFQRDNRGRFPNGQRNYILSTYGNATPPFSNTRWANYLREAVQAIVDHLGADAASKIQYGIGREIGTSGHWTGTQFRFFEFYKASVEAVRSVIPNAKIGSHFLWGTSSKFWGVDFLGYCKRNNVPYDFVGVSYYPFYDRANRTDFNQVFRNDFGVLTSNRNWNSNAKLEIHEFALIESISSAGNSFVDAPPQHQNSFMVGMMKMFYQNNMNDLTLWGDGSLYNPAYSELRGLVGNRFYKNAKSGNQVYDRNYVNGLFSKDESNDSYEIMAYNYSADVNRNQGRGTTENIIVRATISNPPGTRYRWRVVTYNPSNNTISRSAFSQATTTGRNGSNSSTVQFASRRLSGYSWFKYEFNVISTPAQNTPPNGYTLSVNENQTIPVSGTMNVAFGANGQYRFLYNRTSNVACNRNTFGGDPAPGVVKKCYVKSKGDIAIGTYFLKNKASGNYLDSDGTTIRVKAKAGGLDQRWKLAIPADLHYNIDNMFSGRGVLDANANGVVQGSSVESPSTANDKEWTVESLGNNTYRFKNVQQDRFLAEKSSSNAIEHTNWNGDRAQWILEEVSSNNSKNARELEKLANNDDVTRKLKVYPNPSIDGHFTIHLQGAKSMDIKVHNVLGVLVYDSITSGSRKEVISQYSLSSGVYHIRITDENKIVYNHKLIIK